METPNTPEEEGKDLEDANSLFEAYADAVNKEDVKEQEAAMLKAWQHMAEIKVEPSAWLQAMGEAHQRESAFDWIGAEESYKRAVEDTADRPMLQSGAYSKLSALYSLVDLDIMALESAQAATQAARRDNISSLLCLRLQAEAGFYLKAKAFLRTWAIIDEAFAVIGNSPMHNLERASALTLRADCFAQEGECSKSEADLASAWQLLEPHSETLFAAGWQCRFSNLVGNNGPSSHAAR